MSSRCKACNAILSDIELVSIDSTTGTYTEICFMCQADDVDLDDDANLCYNINMLPNIERDIE